MKPGDFVMGTSSSGFQGRPLLGIVISLDRTNTWGDEIYNWWKILREDGTVVYEVEHYLEVIE